MIWRFVQSMFHADLSQGPCRLDHRVDPAHSEVQRTKCDILEDRGHEQLLIGILKYHSDFRAHSGERILSDPHSTNVDLALTLQQSVQVRHKGRLAGSVRAEQRHGLPGKQIEMDAIERFCPVFVLVREVANVNQEFHAINRALSEAPRAQ